MKPDAAPPPARPLARHLLFASQDLDEARERVARVFCPHHLQMETPRARLDARHHHLRGAELSLNYIEYGARTLIDPGEIGGFYLLQIPLCGGADILNGIDRYASDPGHAALLNPQRPTRMVWHEGTRQILIQIDRAALLQAAGAPPGGLIFDGPINLATPEGSALWQLTAFLVAEADRGGQPVGAGRMGPALEGALIGAVLDAHPATAPGRIAAGLRPVRSPQLRRAIEHIHARLDEALSLEEIARAAGVSPRALQLAFRKAMGTTPLAYWRDRRLDAAEADLAQGKATVTEVALRWGFGHFGRFAKAFRARHGILPGAIAARARRG